MQAYEEKEEGTVTNIYSRGRGIVRLHIGKREIPPSLLGNGLSAAKSKARRRLHPKKEVADQKVLRMFSQVLAFSRLTQPRGYRGRLRRFSGTHLKDAEKCKELVSEYSFLYFYTKRAIQLEIDECSK